MDLVFIWLPCNSLLKGGPQPAFRIGGETRCASHEPWGNILWCGSSFYLTVKVFELSLLPRVFLFFWSSVFYFSMTGNMKLCAGHSAWSWSCIFFKGRIFTPVIFSEQVSQKAVSYFHACFVTWLALDQTSQLVEQKSLWNQEALQQCAVAHVACRASSAYTVCRECYIQ